MDPHGKTPAEISREYEQAIIQLKESQQQLHRVANSIPGALIQYKLNPDGTDDLLYVSDQVFEVWGLTKKEVMENVATLWDAILDEDLPAMQKSVMQSAETLQFWDHFYRIRTKDGTLKWLNGRGNPVKQADGSIIWDSLILDITELKKTEQDLREANLRMSLAAESAEFGIWDLNVLTDELSWDPWLLRLYGITEEEFEGKSFSWESRVHADDLDFATETLDNAIRAKETAEVEYRMIRPDGEVRYIYGTAKAIYDEQGNPQRIIGVNKDITERKLAELQLKKSEEEAKAANNAKSEFLNMVNHELRTPLNSIIGPVDLLDMEELSDSGRAALDLIKPAAVQLLGIITDILDLSKLQSGSREVASETVDIVELLEDRLVIFKAEAQKKGLQFSIETEELEQSRIVTDPVALTQILYNLVSNAIKYTEAGSVTVTICQGIVRDTGAPSISVSVTDTGCGIANEDQDNIFDGFHQVDMRISRAHGGVGLGLAIASELADLMGASLSVNSKVGEGSTFKLELPVSKSTGEVVPEPEVKQSNQPDFSLAGATDRLLIVEDDQGNTDFMKLMLRKLKVEADFACNGKEAIDLYQKSTYACVLMDIRLPDLSGDKVVKELRKVSKKRHSRMIACTAFATDEVKKELMEADFDGFLAKPILIDQLKAILQS